MTESVQYNKWIQYLRKSHSLYNNLDILLVSYVAVNFWVHRTLVTSVAIEKNVEASV